MIVVDVAEAESDFYNLIEKVEQGEEVTITRDGEPVARIVPATERRKPGRLAGKITVADDFDAPLDPLTFR